MFIAKKLETVTVIAVAVLAIAISIMDLAGFIDGVGWLRERVSVLTLLVVGAVAAHLIIEQSSIARNQSDIVRSAVDQAVAALEGVEARQFDSREDFWRYAAKRVRESRTIDDLTWGEILPTVRTPQDRVAYNAYRREIELASTGKGTNQRKAYREIMSFPDDIRLQRAAPLMDRRFTNYELRYFDYDHPGTPPLLQFYVFDRREVLISLTPLTRSPLDSRYLSIKSGQLADIMSDYFEAAWRDAIVLKDIDIIRWDILKDIAHRLGSDIFDNR